MHFKSPPVLLAIVVLAGCLACSCVASKQNEAPTEPPKPQISIPLGPVYSIHGYFDEIPLKDKLKLSKSYLRMEVASRASPSDPPVLSFKNSKVEELIRCSNASLLRQDRQQLIDCKTTHDLPLNDLPEPTNLGDEYVRRSSIRIKQRARFMHNSRQDLLLYPLRADVISAKVDATLAKYGLQNMRFVEPNVFFGYYFELTIGDKPNPSQNVICNGDVYLAVNRTDYFVRYKGDPYPEHIDEFQYIINHLEDGHFFHLSDVECYKDQLGLKEIATLAIDFMIAKQQQFPYLTVRHTTKFRPLTALLDYEASVDQTREASLENPHAYNTTVKIVSRSAVLNLLNFDLNQTYINTNQTFSSEHMRVIGTRMGMVVEAFWNGTNFLKVGHLFQAEDLKQAQADGPKIELKSPLEIWYNDSGDDNALLQIKFRKDLFSSLVPSMDWINDMWDAQSKDPNNFNRKPDSREEL